MATVNDLIGASLRDLGVLAGGESASYHDANDALGALNRLLDQWKAERLQIPNVVRTVWPITANQQEYLLGSGTAANTYEDGFDGTWINGAPPDWTADLTGDGTVTEDTSNYVAGGSSVLLDPGTGTAAIYRDFSVKSGERRRISVYGMTTAGGTADVVVRVYNSDTGNYLTSAGAWQSSAIQCINFSNDATWTQRALNFTVETSATVGDVNTNLRVFLYTQPSAADGSFDSLTFESLDAAPIIIPRPVYIDHVNLIDTSADPDLETPLSPLTDDQWAAVAQKAQTSTQPSHWYYNKTHPNGTLSLWPIPTDSDLKLALYVPTPVNTFAALSTTVSLPPGWERMIVKNLALELAPSYGRTPSPALVQQASDAKATVKRSNTRLSDLSFEAAALIGNGGGWYNIKTG